MLRKRMLENGSSEEHYSMKVSLVLGHVKVLEYEPWPTLVQGRAHECKLFWTKLDPARHSL